MKRNTIEYVCYNEECKHNNKGFCQLKGIKPNGCINAISKQGYVLGIEWRDKEINRLTHQLALTEKALELACEEITGSCEYCSYASMPECPIEADCVEEKIKYFKQQAEREVENE